MAGLGAAGRGQVGRGSARHGAAWPGMAWRGEARRGEARRGEARQGMARDGGLRPLFVERIKTAHWQAVETWSTGQGVPDMNVCLNGIETWLEFKGTTTNTVRITPEQVAWIERRLRAGGRCLVIVRWQCAAGSRRQARDELLIYAGAEARTLMLDGIAAAKPLARWAGGPRAWNWNSIAKLLEAK